MEARLSDSLFIAKSELKSIVRDKFKFLAVIAVIMIPLVYGGLYLWAFWDPYNNLDNLAIAVVNLDAGSYQNGSYENFGNKLVDQIKNDTTVKWEFEKDYSTAQKGLKNRDYYAILIIPANFSEKIESIQEPYPEKAQILFETRDANNFLATRITNEVAQEVTKKLNEETSRAYILDILRKTRVYRQNLSQAETGTEELSEGLGTLEGGIEDLYDGSVKINDGIKDVSSSLDLLVNGSKQIENGSMSIYQKSLMISAQLEQLSTLAVKLKAAGVINESEAAKIQYLAGAYSQIVSAQQQIYLGNANLRVNLEKLDEGSKALGTGADKLEEGLESAVKKTPTAREGAEELYTTVKKINELALKNLSEGRIFGAALMELEPVELVDISTNKSQNYGTGLAPYFVQLSLWVGGLLLLLIIVPRDNRLAISKFSRFSITLGKSIVPAGVGIIQAIVLDIVLIGILGLNVQSIWIFFGFTILLSVTFMAILQFFIFLFGKAGEIPCIIILMLQLTSSAGTFPVETSAPFFQTISPYLPMTYGMVGLREIIVGGEFDMILTVSKVLLAFLLIFFFARLIVTRKKVTLIDIKPLIDI